ncbi:hypothetical protein M406DRAFT_268212 [Cryphonectria parasitica EP155]|uniref:Uncharacterized protein n=1 Tax=Cryphonectria parasitica (strain ATCC 38755 / EP155) TaxID=660469 RepID=A0A9P5CIR5_CRYP1|nr:uncharacterized protein M406DRAFT_268212 [Cryphonectria parasitica EP155]KAF3760683.1 hypothetical protein M406DRAFT_268212 [Cryphonectria parasitica EP155]
MRQDTAHQQKILNIFQSTFSSVLLSSGFNTLLQEVKSALFSRDFEKAFGKEDYLEAYAARWSPTRALCYAAVLDGIRSHLEQLCGRQPQQDEDGEGGDERARAVLRVLAIGGAAAELASVASHLSRQPPETAGSISLLDVASWAGVVDKLQTGLTTPPKLSKYASAAAQAANTAFVTPSRLQDVDFKQHDVLALSREDLSILISPDSSSSSSSSSSQSKPVLVTLLFTLNELFTAAGIGKTTTFLLTLTSVLPAGSLLLVVDSPGSYSETTVGKEAKRYPMQWLLDRVLLGAEQDGEEEEEAAGWEKIEAKDSVWFRLAPELRYPIALEDMRYQMHLYRRVIGNGKIDG